MRDTQSVAGMVDEVLARWARARADQTGESFGDALEAILKTEAGRQLRELGSGPYRRDRADDWQANVARERAEERAAALGWRLPPETSDRSKDN